MRKVPFAELLGKTITSLQISGDREKIEFKTACGKEFLMCHQYECCESVSIEDIVGDIDDLIGNPLLVAEESTSSNWGKQVDDSCLWTFYKLATIKGYVDIRWFGHSNGYYGVEVDLYEVNV